MDFGRLSLGNGMWLHLYGTPGQTRFDFMWDLLIRRAHGCILLVPAHLPAHIKAARGIKSFMKERSECPFVIGITHGDHPNAWSPEDIQLVLGDEGGSIPYISLNANQPESVAETLLTLVSQWSLADTSELEDELEDELEPSLI
jgi:hypothetical protein